MDRDQARRMFQASTRFPSSDGRVRVTDVQLADMIATVRAERRTPVQQPRAFQQLGVRAG